MFFFFQLSLKLPKSIGRPADKTFAFSTDISNVESTLTISFIPKFASELKFTPEAPQTWSLLKLPTTWNAENKTSNFESPIIIKISPGDKTEKIEIIIKLTVCKTDECIPKKFKVSYQINRNSEASNNVMESKELEIK